MTSSGAEETRSVTYQELSKNIKTVMAKHLENSALVLQGLMSKDPGLAGKKWDDVLDRVYRSELYEVQKGLSLTGEVYSVDEIEKKINKKKGELSGDEFRLLESEVKEQRKILSNDHRDYLSKALSDDIKRRFILGLIPKQGGHALQVAESLAAKFVQVLDEDIPSHELINSGQNYAKHKELINNNLDTDKVKKLATLAVDLQNAAVQNRGEDELKRLRGEYTLLAKEIFDFQAFRTQGLIQDIVNSLAKEEKKVKKAHSAPALNSKRRESKAIARSQSAPVNDIAQTISFDKGVKFKITKLLSPSIYKALNKGAQVAEVKAQITQQLSRKAYKKFGRSSYDIKEKDLLKIAKNISDMEASIVVTTEEIEALSGAKKSPFMSKMGESHRKTRKRREKIKSVQENTGGLRKKAEFVLGNMPLPSIEESVSKGLPIEAVSLNKGPVKTSPPTPPPRISSQKPKAYDNIEEFLDAKVTPSNLKKAQDDMREMRNRIYYYSGEFDAWTPGAEVGLGVYIQKYFDILEEYEMPALKGAIEKEIERLKPIGDRAENRVEDIQLAQQKKEEEMAKAKVRQASPQEQWDESFGPVSKRGVVDLEPLRQESSTDPVKTINDKIAGSTNTDEGYDTGVSDNESSRNNSVNRVVEKEPQKPEGKVFAIAKQIVEQSKGQNQFKKPSPVAKPGKLPKNIWPPK